MLKERRRNRPQLAMPPDLRGRVNTLRVIYSDVTTLRDEPAYPARAFLHGGDNRHRGLEHHPLQGRRDTIQLDLPSLRKKIVPFTCKHDHPVARGPGYGRKYPLQLRE